jgi:hypothetical protein
MNGQENGVASPGARSWVAACALAILVLGGTARADNRPEYSPDDFSPVASRWAELLRSADRDDRLEAVEHLGNLGPRAVPAVPQLTSMLMLRPGVIVISSGDEHRLAFAAELALQRIGPPAVPGLVATLKGDDQAARQYVLRVLAEIRSPEAIEPLLTVLKEKPRLGLKGEGPIDLRPGAISALSAQRDPRAVAPLLAILKSDEALELRSAAARGLATIGDPASHRCSPGGNQGSIAAYTRRGDRRAGAFR